MANARKSSRFASKKGSLSNELDQSSPFQKRLSEVLALDKVKENNSTIEGGDDDVNIDCHLRRFNENLSSELGSEHLKNAPSPTPISTMEDHESMCSRASNTNVSPMEHDTNRISPLFAKETDIENDQAILPEKKSLLGEPVEGVQDESLDVF